MSKNQRHEGATLSQQIAGLIEPGSLMAATATEESMQTQVQIDEKANESAQGMFTVTTATLPTNLAPAAIDMKQEQFHSRGKLYYLGAAVAATISVIMLFAIKFAEDLDIEDWAEDPVTTILGYGGLVLAFLLWRRGEQCIDRLKTLGMMLRNYYAHSLKQKNAGQ